MARRDRSSVRSGIGDFSDPALISTLTTWLGASGASELEISTTDGHALKIVLAPDVSYVKPHDAAQDAAAPVTEGWAVKAPLAGVFRDRHPGGVDASPLAREGSTLEAGEIAGFVEVGPILLPVIAPKAAIVAGVQARAGELVGYGDPVFMMEHAQ
jgi:biotin carboxyl carrier protein